ncbi:FAD-dependent oxidoreductase [Pseudonocardia lacus]|uniref:FAD-dependent oxidoreductase n=1 Tax=Pseudonocardia lacus TaxID=2835865 RepID=UPI001BDD7BC4|nr:FAD-dependent oxidoreductase [Pseudonocardia lacus]
MPDVDAVVVGGGIGGLSTALALTRAGRRVRVLEAADRFGELGAGLQMAANATRILRSWGLLDEVVARGVVPRRLVMRDAVDGAELTHLDLVDAERRYGAPYIVIHRGDLHSILLEACRAAGVDLVTAAAVTDVEQGPGYAEAVSSRRRDRGRAVIAADGLRSGARRYFGDDHAIDSGYTAYRGVLPVSQLDTSGLTLDDVVVYVGPDRHLVQYPLRRGEIFNQVAVFRTSTTRGTPEELDEAFAGSCAQVLDAMAHLDRERTWPVRERAPIRRWVDGRLALTGDAAHAMLQYFAQGACQALEDAQCLADRVAAHPGDWDAALREYEQERIPRATLVQTRVHDWGELWHCDGLFRVVRNVLLRDRDPRDYRFLDWLYAEP